MKNSESTLPLSHDSFTDKKGQFTDYQKTALDDQKLKDSSEKDHSGSSDSEINPYDCDIIDIEEEFKEKTVTGSTLKQLSMIRKKIWVNRVFRGVPQGSIRGSVFTLFSGAVGAGVLSLPKVVSFYGLGVGLLIIVLNAFLAYFSYWAQFQAIIKSGKKKYPNLINFYLGRVNAKIFAWFIIGVTFISANVYVCMAWNFIEYILDEFGIVEQPRNSNGDYDEYSAKMWMVRAIAMICLMVIVIPIALMKSQNTLRFMSIFNLQVLLYVIILGAIQCPEYINHGINNGDYQIEYISKTPSMDWLAGFSTIILSYMCHPNFFYIRKELLHPSTKRVKKVLIYSILIETTVYLSMGTIGYLSQGDKQMVPLFTLRPKINEGDWAMKIGVFLFQILSITNIGINLYPCREQIVSIYKKENDKKFRSTVAILTLTCCFMITIVYPNIMGIFGLCGGMFCTYIGWVFPFQIMIRMMPDKKWYQYPKLWYYLGYIFIVLISVFSTVQSLFWFNW